MKALRATLEKTFFIIGEMIKGTDTLCIRKVTGAI
jgi:hypothetical protein